MKKYIIIVVTIISSLISINTYATVCFNSSEGSVKNIDFPVTSDIEKSGNVAGYTFTERSNASIDVKARCPKGAEYNGYSMRSYVTNFPIEYTENNLQYIKLNDYLLAAIKIHDSWSGDYYPPVNYFKMGPSGDIPAGNDFPVGDSNLEFHFKIIKPFVGSVPYTTTPVFNVYVTTTDADPLNTVVYTISYSGKITVPQSCELNAGQTIIMNFGDIGASAFSQAGAGNKPAGVNPQTRTIGIQCKNVDAQAMLSLRLEASKVSGNAVISDNPDLGFVVADGSHNPLTPNNIDSKIPFWLDDNASATVPVSAWPVSVTGNKPAEGKFTSEGYLRVDFD